MRDTKNVGRGEGEGAVRTTSNFAGERNSKADLLQTNKELPVYMDLPLHD